MEHVRKVLRRLKENGIELKAEKCDMFNREVVYLGRIVTEDGYRVDPKSTKALLKLRGYKPKPVGEVRHLTGLLGYYRRYMENFSRIAKPIYDLLKVEQPGSLKGRKKDKRGKGNQASSRTPIIWQETHQKALDYLISCLSNPPRYGISRFQYSIRTSHRRITRGSWCSFVPKTARENESDRVCLTYVIACRKEVPSTFGKTRAFGVKMGSDRRIP